MAVNVLVAEPNSITRAGLHSVIKQARGLACVGEAASAAEVLQRVAELQPDVVLLAEELLESDEPRLMAGLAQRRASTAVLVLGRDEAPSIVERILTAGAVGFLTRDTPLEELFRGIQRAADGDPVVNARVFGQILRRSQRGAGSETLVDPATVLSERELEVLRMTGLGLEAKEIANQLKLSPRTIDVHRANIRRKLGIEGVHQLLRFALRWIEHRTADGTHENFADADRPLLLVDDDEVDILSVRRSFRDLGLEIAIQVARSGEEALAFLRNSGNPRPSLILLDVKMPGMDGREFLAEVRAAPRLRSLPVVVLTSSRQEEDKARMYALGLTGYLVKPNTSGELTRMLRNLVRFFAMSEQPPAEAA